LKMSKPTRYNFVCVEQSHKNSEQQCAKVHICESEKHRSRTIADCVTVTKIPLDQHRFALFEQ
jgi:hypothetical protein